MIKTIATKFCTKQQARLFLFAGQGTQELGMLSTIPDKLKNEGIELAKKLLNLDLEQIATIDEGKMINQTQVTQPLLLLSHYLHFRKNNYHQTLSKDDWMVGHSLGQYSALVNASSMSLEDGLKLVHLRGKLMKKYTTVPHGMLVVKFKKQTENDIREEISKAGLEIACINTRTSIIVAGQKEKIHALAKVMRTHKAAALTLPVSTAFHCKMLNAMRQQLVQALEKVTFKPPQCHILRNYDCQHYKNEKDIRQGLLLQLTNPVQFQHSIEKIPQSAQLIEVGHKRWISTFANEVRRQSFVQSLVQ